jgi:agmatinase
MHDIRALGIAEIVDRTASQVGDGPTFLSVDIDVVDPAFAPGTGTPEPGGLTSSEVLELTRRLGERLNLVGADLVEVAPLAFGSEDITALLADRIVREILTGMALRRRSG